ncbi:WXG100-like domain-containing protein [[Actinomadura] parvosata]|uniref:WXG100-like domain-containing protein n=1 Tax=[Actinomadura] parvosata TaxID=1955412 RepID=UPI00406C1AB2
MGLTLPAPLPALLNELGHLWPEVDEESLHRLATAWAAFGGRLAGITGQADVVAEAVRRGNAGEAVEAFLTAWKGDGAPRTAVAEGATGAQVVGVCLVICAALVLALKIVLFVQLVALLVRMRLAVAAAPATSGGSLLAIPALKRLTGTLVNLSMNQASRVLVA